MEPRRLGKPGAVPAAPEPDPDPENAVLAETAGHHIVLVGPMGVGKTTVGGLLAGHLGRPLHDSDAELLTTHRNARELAERQGVDALHRLEADLLLDALASPTPQVITAAASVVEDPRALRVLHRPFVVWLTAPPEVLVARQGSGDHRRDLGTDPEEALAELDRRRAPGYRSIADVTLDVRGRRPEQLAQVVLDRLAQLPGER
jgi:shikimate kinase